MEFQFQLSPKKIQEKALAQTSQKKPKEKRTSQVSFENFNQDLNTQNSPKRQPGSLARSRTSNNQSPQNEKFKRHFSMKVTRLIEENFNLKQRNQHLKEVNKQFVDNLGHKEQVNRTKSCLAKNAGKELGFHVNKFDDMRWYLKTLDDRERFQEKNLRGLINYAKKLTKELDDFKEKVQMAERIIQDLRNTGNESLDSLINMLNGYKEKQEQGKQEIRKLQQLIVLKDSEIQGLDEDILELKDIVLNAKDRQESKIQELLNTVDQNKQLIRRQDKLIVDLQQKNDVCQNQITQCAEETAKRLQEKAELQIKLKETDFEKGTLKDQISEMENKISTFRVVNNQTPAVVSDLSSQSPAQVNLSTQPQKSPLKSAMKQ